MRIGVNGNRLVATGDVGIVTAHAAEVAAAGVPAYWLAQHPAGALDALTALGAIAASTPSLSLGTGVVPVWGRHPVALAGQIATTAQCVRSPLTVGIGLSHRAMVDQHLGAVYDRPVAMMREFLAVLMPLVRDGAVDQAGELFAGHATFACGPSSAEVLVAAMGPQMLRLAGAHADGTIVSWTGPRTLSNHVIPTISDAAVSNNRPPPRIAAVFSACVTDDVAGARAAVDKWFEFHGSAPSYDAMLAREGVDSASEVALIGTESAVTERILDLRERGVTDLVIGEALPDDGRTRELLARLAADTAMSG